MKTKQFSIRYEIILTGESSGYLEHSIEEFVMDTMLPLFQDLTNSNETLEVQIQKDILPLDKKKSE